MSQPYHPPVALGEGLYDLPGSIRRTIVDQNQLECDASFFEYIGDSSVQGRNIACLIHRGYDHAQPRHATLVVAAAQPRGIEVPVD